MPSASTGRLMAVEIAHYLNHHIFLPPKLPQSDDYSEQLDASLIKAALDGLTVLRSFLSHAELQAVDEGLAMLRSMQIVHSTGDVSEIELTKALGKVVEQGTSVPLNIRAQNAGVLISKEADSIRFDVFELSPTNESVMSTQGRLHRTFPGAAVSITMTDFEQPGLAATTAQMLSDMSTQPVAGMQPTARKAGKDHDEDRDTTHPGIVSELFVGFLLSIGKPAAVPSIAKNTREDVLWEDARSPWHRSATWLLIRVALQMTFARRRGAEKLYKEAMVIIMCEALQHALRCDLPSDVVYCMTAKIVKRMLKIDSGLDPKALAWIEGVLKEANALLNKRWEDVQRNAAPKLDTARLAALNFDDDAGIPLPVLDEYIDFINAREETESSSTFVPTTDYMEFSADELPQLLLSSSSDRSYAIVNLAGFEEWVSSHGRSWSRQRDYSACKQVSGLMKDYHALARQFYSGNPEGLSVMVLTIYELWIMCDMIAVVSCPLLAQYGTGMPLDVLESLALPFKHQMNTLRLVEKYILERRGKASYDSFKVYSDHGSSDCFAVRYFDQSQKLQHEMQRIKDWATKERDEKIAELSRQKSEYTRLIQLYQRGSCDYFMYCVDRFNNFYEERHSHKCKRCRNKATADGLSIHVHEWPLPSDNDKAKMVTFELHAPNWFCAWRDATFYVFKDVLEAAYSSGQEARSMHPLSSDPHLQPFSALPCSQRIGLLSQDKPHVVTHRRVKKVSTTTESSICLSNGMNYQYFDFNAGRFVGPVIFDVNVARACTYKLPERTRILQKYLFRPASMPNGREPNEVIAGQAEFPDRITLEEGKDLCILPAGHRIQWYNVLIQLEAPSIDFKKEEVALVMFQCLNQTGPPGNTPSTLRAAHEPIHDERLALALLDTLENATLRIKENWQSAQALSVFSSTISRLLSLTASEQVKTKCVDLLVPLRDIALGWVDLLREKAQGALTSDERKEFQSRIVEVAMICALCFDVDEEHLDCLLSSSNGASILIQCSILIQEGKCSYSAASQPVFSLLDLRFRRLLYRASATLQTHLAGVHDAIQKAWSAYRSYTEWQSLPGSAKHWLMNFTAPSSGGTVLQVHYNLLTGELLVNGLPLDRPPSKYEQHPLWRRLFGNAAIEVMPTSIAGMQFSAKRQYHKHDVHFGLSASGSSSAPLDLIVLASKDETTYETIPSRLFHGDYPLAFVQDFIHWYNRSNETIEFRHSSKVWDTRAEWILRKSATNSKWYLKKDKTSLFGCQTLTARTISDLLLALSEPYNVHCIYKASMEQVEVHMPKLELDFCLKKGTMLLQSKQFRGMYVEKDQSIGTLVGFPKLVLENKSGHRSVLLPEGPLSSSYMPTAGHVTVTVTKDRIEKIHPLQIDRQLGRITDNGSLQGKLFVAYAHALTAFCLPDPLLLRTGTEQAFTILESAAVRSFDQLSEAEMAILVQIANLTPPRSYYPRNERVMQSVSWSSRLSFLAQHNRFRSTVQSILDQAERYLIFFPESDLRPPSLQACDSFLLDRDCLRTSTFRISAFGAEEHSTAYDSRYAARDTGHGSVKACNAYAAAMQIYGQCDTYHWNVPKSSYLWADLQEESIISGPQRKLGTLKYSGLSVSSGLDVSTWLAIHESLKSPNHTNKFEFMGWLSAISNADEANMRLVQTLILIFNVGKLRDIPLPKIDSARPSEGYRITKIRIENILRYHSVGLEDSPEAKLPSEEGEEWETFRVRRDGLFTTKRDQVVETLANHYHNQWPKETPLMYDYTEDEVKATQYIDLPSVILDVNAMFKACYENRLLKNYLQKIEEQVAELSAARFQLPAMSMLDLQTTLPVKCYVSASDLFTGAAPTFKSLSISCLQPNFEKGSPTDVSALDSLIQDLQESSHGSEYETRYVGDLRESLESLKQPSNVLFFHPDNEHGPTNLTQYEEQCAQSVEAMFLAIIFSLKTASQAMPGSRNAFLAHLVEHFPRISPLFLLGQLHHRKWTSLTPEWKACLVAFGRALTALQRAKRMVAACKNSKTDELIKEIENIGHTNWDPLQRPDSLLMEIESDIMIRAVQTQIASEMETPSTGTNSVMQLHMGEGKSSVIVPMVAAAVADSSQLVRIIVAKPQSKQMAQMLISKLGGLIGRRVYFMPFSRKLQLSVGGADTVGRIVRECMQEGGVLLVQPEHILSFQLMGIDAYNSEKAAVGQSFVSTQDFFDKSSRDIVDESDDIFSTKFELIYTVGTQTQIEYSPGRWSCIHQVLGLVQRVLNEHSEYLGPSVEVKPGDGGGFAMIRFLEIDVEHFIIERVAAHICEFGLDGFPISQQPEEVRKSVFAYITEADPGKADIAAVEAAGPGRFWTDSTKSPLLLLRGLLAGGVLAFAFGSKRWRVNYGLVSTRDPPTKLAVPYRAKDSPSARSEFSHPDVVIVLTSLSYYYGGLTDEDLFLAFDTLMNSDQAIVEYNAWVKRIDNLPSAFRQLEGVNLRDRSQCVREIFPHLRKSKAVADFFMANIVFPKEMKEFPNKISCSGWDLGKIKTHCTTGFSGTNDSRKVLPLDVAHLDLHQQKHTNALVLNHLLQPDNAVESMSRTTSNAEALIRAVTTLDPPVHVLLDAGALILEFTNQQVASRWLELHPAAQAVVYVDDDDELSVLDRTGRKESLQISPYLHQLDVCLVYLDEGHTRGIDLKLPKQYRAAVSLGANLTKDRLVQACMRMRKLGKGQTVTFLVPEEIQNKIRACTAKSGDKDIQVADVLRWAMSETFAEIRRAMPLWTMQGQRFLFQEELLSRVRSTNGTNMTTEHAMLFLEQEAQSLEYRYRPHDTTTASLSGLSQLSGRRGAEILARCKEFEYLQFNSRTLQEEQERELSPEIELEAQIERPAAAEKAPHSIHPHVVQFLHTGVAMADTVAYMPAFQSLSNTRAAEGFDLSQLAGDRRLLVTADFARTVKTGGKGGNSMDQYQRPVQWILAAYSADKALITTIMIISPFEAQDLIVRSSSPRNVVLHLYKPRCNSAYRSFDRLDFFSIPFQVTPPSMPRSLAVQLNLFAGQLYLSSYADYLEVCAFLGLISSTPKPGQIVAADGFILNNANKKLCASPVKFLHELMGKIRRNGQGIGKTHMGQILDGKLLERRDFDGED